MTTRTQIPVLTGNAGRWIPHLYGKPVGNPDGYRTKREAITAAKAILVEHATQPPYRLDRQAGDAGLDGFFSVIDASGRVVCEGLECKCLDWLTEHQPRDSNGYPSYDLDAVPYGC